MYLPAGVNAMRYLKIFSLHFQQISQHRARSFVWFLLSLFNPLILLLFWNGVFKTSSEPLEFTLNEITTYYLLLVVAGSTLMSHVEETVASMDIQEGRLVTYLIRPVSYYWMKFFEEIHHRILQGFYGVVILTALTAYFGQLITFPTDPTRIFLTIVIAVFAYFIAFTLKMVVSFIGFWATDIGGLYEVMEVIILVLAGYVLPLHLLPAPLDSIAYTLPFSHIIYFPVVAFQGLLEVEEMYRVIFSQSIWLLFFLLVYQLMWARGLKHFTGVGQ